MTSASLISWLRSDGRHFQIISQLSFLIYGIFFLEWDQHWLNYAAAFAGTLSVQALACYYKVAPLSSLKSAFITALGLSLLLKANHPGLFFLAGSISIGQKFLIRYNGKHLWNPANFGIIISIILSGNTWVSPGQWGSQAIFVLISSTAGFTVLSRIKRMDTSLIFLFSLGVLEWMRTIIYLGWDWEVWLHKMTNGSVFLFAFFMITDPMTTPSKKSIRIFWTIAVAAISFTLTNFYYINASVQWVLFFATPLTPLLDKIFRGNAFQWRSAIQSSSTI